VLWSLLGVEGKKREKGRTGSVLSLRRGGGEVVCDAAEGGLETMTLRLEGGGKRTQTSANVVRGGRKERGVSPYASRGERKEAADSSEGAGAGPGGEERKGGGS